MNTPTEIYSSVIELVVLAVSVLIGIFAYKRKSKEVEEQKAKADRYYAEASKLNAALTEKVETDAKLKEISNDVKSTSGGSNRDRLFNDWTRD